MVFVYLLDTISYPMMFLVGKFIQKLLFGKLVLWKCSSFPVFKATNPGLTSYSQVNLYKHVMGESYQAHDSLQDAMTLNKLLLHLNPDIHTKLCHTYSWDQPLKELNIEYSEMGTNLMSPSSPLWIPSQFPRVWPTKLHLRAYLLFILN